MSAIKRPVVVAVQQGYADLFDQDGREIVSNWDEEAAPTLREIAACINIAPRAIELLRERLCDGDCCRSFEPNVLVAEWDAALSPTAEGTSARGEE